MSMQGILSAVLLVLALCGLALSVYFTLLYYRVVRPSHSSSNFICRFGRSACESVVFTPYGRLFYLPNSVYGISFHLLICGVALARMGVGQGAFFSRAMLLNIALVSAAFSVAVGIYLVHALFNKLRTPCVLCLLGHGINVLIAAVLIALKMYS